MNEFFAAASTDPRVRRMQRYFAAALTSFMAILMFGLCFGAGFIDLNVFLTATVVAAGLLGLFFPVFYFGWNLRFADPSLFVPQSMCGIVVISYVLVHAGPVRPALSLLFFAALTFAAFRFNWRGFVVLAAFTLLCYAMVIWMAWQIDPRNMNLRAEILYWFFMAMLMPWLGAMASYLGQQRQRYQAGAALYRTVWSTSVDAVLVFDDKYQIRMANPAASRLFGHDEKRLIGMALIELFPERVRAALVDDIAGHVKGNKSGRDLAKFEEITITADGREVVVEAALAELGGVGGRQGLFANDGRRFALFAHDISQRHALESIKDNFMATMSHELRTPLMAVMGAVEALQTDERPHLPVTARSLLDMAAGGVERLRGLIETMLNLQKLDTGGIEFDPAPMSGAAMLRQAVDSERPMATSQGKFLALTRLDDAVTVRADRRWIHEVLVNLIDNALKFSPAGATVIAGMEPLGNVVRFTVVDSGPGVPAEFSTRIFTRFERADHSNTAPTGGAGLGLSVCKAVVEGCGGRIDFFNNPKKGATFWFELPRVG